MGALGAVQTSNANGPSNNIAGIRVRRGNISIAKGSAVEVGDNILIAIFDILGQLCCDLRIY